MSFNFTCSHCKATLQAEDDWAGRETVCPVCQKKVTILHDPLSDDTLPLRQPPPREAASEATSQATEKAVETGKKSERFTGNRNASHFHWLGGGRKYFWGRLYILSMWILVALTLVIGALFIIEKIDGYQSLKKKGYNDLLKNIPDLVTQQNAFAGKLVDTIDLLAAKKQIDGGANVKITGFKLSQSIRQKEFVFNEVLETVADIEESLATMEECKDTIKELQDEIKKELEEQLHGLQLLIDGQNGRSRGPAQVSLSRGQVGAIRIGLLQQAEFYTQEVYVRKAIGDIRRELASIKRLYPDNIKVKNDLDSLSRFLDFIQNNLLSHGLHTILEQEQENSTPDSSNHEQKKVPGEQEYMNIVEQLATFYLAWNESKPNPIALWYIAGEYNTLYKKLTEYKDSINKYDEDIKNKFRECCEYCFKTILICIVVSFFLLVIADVLRAHFDCAEFMLQKKEND